MRIRCRIHQCAVRYTAKRVDGIDELPFAVVLGKVDINVELRRDLAQPALNLRQSGRSIYVRLPGAEQV